MIERLRNSLMRRKSWLAIVTLCEAAGRMGCLRLMPCNNSVVGGGQTDRPLFVVDFMLRLTLKPQHVTVVSLSPPAPPGQHYDNTDKILSSKAFPLPLPLP